jgi:hypothetical protein
MTEEYAVDPHIQALRDAFVADNELEIADTQRHIDEAPDEWRRKFHTDQLRRLQARAYPWEDLSTTEIVRSRGPAARVGTAGTSADGQSTEDPHTQAPRDARVVEHERALAKAIAKAERCADEATDEWGRKFYAARVRRLRDMGYPWEDSSGAEMP